MRTRTGWAWLLAALVGLVGTGAARTQVTLGQAVGTAEREAGGRAVKADKKDKDGTVEFKVEVLNKDGEKVHVHLGPDGKVTEQKPGKKDKKPAPDLKDVLPLAEAIRLAEQKTGLTAVKADLHAKGDAPVKFKVELLDKDGAKQKIELDQRGQVLEPGADKQAPKADQVEIREAPAAARTVYRADSLPEGLPAWFGELDADRDGQVGLYEWRRAAGRSPQEFRMLDPNDDGLLTIDEALRVAGGEPSVAQRQ